MIVKQQTYNAAIYCRLSAEDNLAGESGSISTQRTLLTQYCKDKGFNIAGYFIEKVFEMKNIRYIAVDDNIDTLNNNNDILMPIKNVLNDMYAKDKKEIEALKNRIADLDKIIKKLYKDNALGKITDKRFTSLSGEYEKEQQELAEKLDAKILNELIDKIVVHHKTLNEAGEKVQKIEIYYKFVGLLQTG